MPQLLQQPQRILQPQEIEVFYIIPAIRRLFTLALKKEGKSQKEIASILGVKEATISQYVSNKRAASITLDPQIESTISEAASRLHSPMEVIRETQHLLKVIRDARQICKVHIQLSHLPESCDIKIMGCNL